MATGRQVDSGGGVRSTRERLLDSAVRIFQTRGYHGAGLSEILEETGLPKGSLYHAFPGGKEELAIAALRWLDGEVGALLERGAHLGWSGEKAALGMARHVEAGLRDPAAARGSLVAVLAQDACPGSAPITQALRSMLSRWEGLLAGMFEAADGVGEARARARLALALLEGGALVARIHGRPGLVADIVRAGMAVAPGG